MFAKLLKYEWKANAPLLGILSLAALGAGLLGGLSLRLSDAAPESELAEAMVAATTGLSLTFLVLALAAYVFATTFLLLYRFYKNKFTDQGYLTFTLPVTSHHIFLSSLTMLLLWQVITTITTLVSVTLMIVVGGVLPDDPAAYTELQYVYQDLLGFQNGKLTIALTLIQGFIGWLFGNVLTLTCIVLGASWAKKHKLLVAFLLYYGISFVLEFVTGTLTLIVTLTSIHSDDYMVTMQITSLCTIVVQLLLMAGGYLLSNYMMTRRLNLS